MRLSCNGCRVLRKGCTPDCPIRPCLYWIKTPHSQSNATLFLAKFYGRAGLFNLLTAGSPHLRPAIFKSLLYEACGRIVNPVSGSTGLLSTGRWHLCEAAVEAVLSGAQIQQVPSESALDGVGPQLKACDIRHVAKSGKSWGSDLLHKVKSRKCQFKRRAGKPKPNVDSAAAELVVTRSGSELDGSVSRDAGSGVSENRSVTGEDDSGSVESVEPARADDRELELELTLGWGPMKRNVGIALNGSDDDTCRD